MVDGRVNAPGLSTNEISVFSLEVQYRVMSPGYGNIGAYALYITEQIAHDSHVNHTCWR